MKRSLAIFVILLLFATAQAADQLVPENLAAGKTATADASQNGHPPGHALDGDLNTRWCADGAALGHWWQVDLGKPQAITGCRIVWESDGRIYRYKVEGSADANQWQMLSDQTKTESRAQDQTLKFNADAIRYVRITATELPSGGWMSFWEFEVHGTKLVKAVAKPRAVTLRDVKVPDGFNATLFAGPPQVSYPTCVVAAPTGEVFVGIDENGSLGKDKTRRQQVLRLRDEDGDGVAEKINVFADNVGSVRGMFYHDGKLWVLHPPLLRVFYDDDRDGVADRNETLVAGLGTPALAQRGADHCTNGFGVGIDGWIYIAVGDFGFTEAKAKDGSTARLYGGGIARVRMDGSELEIYARNTRNIYDVAVSPEMNLFTRDNTNDGGGWDVRLSHIIQTGNYGYPRSFKNFPADMVQPLADYGGGSPTGSVYVDEPVLPAEYTRSLYTCDWGRNVIYRHPLTAKGAGFTAEQESFVQLPRPTDMDVDARGNIYISSWKNGQFAYKGDNVGYVIRVVASDQPERQPAGDIRKASADELLKMLASGSHVTRLHGQLEILRRDDAMFTEPLETLMDGDEPLSVRVATLYTLKQLAGVKSHAALLPALKDDVLREHALRALADRKGEIADVPLKEFTTALTDDNARVRLAAAIGLGRLGDSKAGGDLAKATADADPLVAHAAVNALVGLQAVDELLTALDNGDAKVQAGCLQALRQIHTPAVVDGLAKRLPEARKSNPELYRNMLTALCRLALTEGEWNGSWWGTRPDTRGPYFKPTPWSETDRILELLKGEAASGDEATLAHLRVELPRHRIDTKGWNLAERDGPSLAEMLDAATPDAKAIPLLAAAAMSAKQPAAIRARALAALLRAEGTAANQAAFEAVLSFDNDKKMPPELQVARWRYIFAPSNANALEELRNQTTSEDPQRRELALAAIAALKNEAKPAEGLIKDLPYEETVAAALKQKGNIADGARLFVKQQCVKCHTIAPGETPIGPFLGGIAKRYKPAELAESILRPSAKIAQGFGTQQIITDEGKIVSGFVITESGDDLQLRTADGVTLTLAIDSIDERIEQKDSIMPNGLADTMTPAELASLLAFLSALNDK